MRRIVKANPVNDLPQERNDSPSEDVNVLARLQEDIEYLQDYVDDSLRLLAEAEIGVRERGENPANIAYYTKHLGFWEERLMAAQRNLERYEREMNENKKEGGD